MLKCVRPKSSNYKELQKLNKEIRRKIKRFDINLDVPTNEEGNKKGKKEKPFL